jgi:hypothetical protein
METQAIESKFNDESKSKIESQANELILIKNPLLTTILPADLESFRIESESNRARRNRKPILSKSIPSIKNRIEIAKNEPGPPWHLWKPPRVMVSVDGVLQWLIRQLGKFAIDGHCPIPTHKIVP